jgi:hypothetical protein
MRVCDLGVGSGVPVGQCVVGVGVVYKTCEKCYGFTVVLMRVDGFVKIITGLRLYLWRCGWSPALAMYSANMSKYPEATKGPQRRTKISCTCTKNITKKGL